MEDMDTNEINMLDFPNEILIPIFYNLNDFSQLHATRVCRRFKMIAEEAFSRKYDGTSETKYYMVNVSSENLTEEQKQHRSFFCTFGENMNACKIGFENGEVVAKEHWMISLIQRYCRNLEKITIANGKQIHLSKMIYFMSDLKELCLQELTLSDYLWSEVNHTKMVSFSATNVQGLDRHFSKFIGHNTQLEDVSLVNSLETGNGLLTTLTKLKQLKSLVLKDEEIDFASNSTNFEIDSLKTLIIQTPDHFLLRLMRTIQSGCKNIEHLFLWNSGYNLMDVKVIDLLCGFDELKMLEFKAYELSLELIQVLVERLPNLVSLSILSDAETIFTTDDDLYAVVSACQKLSILTLTTDYPFILNHEFYTRFCCFLQTNKSNLKLKLCCDAHKTILTEEEGRVISKSYGYSTHKMLYWKGYDLELNLSDKNLLDLSDKILMKITGFLDASALHSFYKTCKQTNILVKKHLSQNVFYCSDEFIDEDVFMSFGNHIVRMELKTDFDTSDEGNVVNKVKLINCINKYSGSGLIEIVVDGRFKGDTELLWPNLKKLTFSCFADDHTLQRLNCPNLTYLEIECYNPKITNAPVDWSHSFRNLTSIKLQNYNKRVEQLLYEINEKFCGQLKELCLEGSGWGEKNERRCWINLNNIIARFRQLVGLHLHLKGIENSNFKFLFENCTKLITLTIFCTDVNQDTILKYMQMFRVIKENCREMKSIQLVGGYANLKPTFLEIVNATFPTTAINLIGFEKPNEVKCLRTLKKRNKM